MIKANVRQAAAYLVLLFAVSMPSAAVEVTDGPGDVLIFPTTYTDARFSSLITIRNEAEQGLVVRVVARDGRDGQELTSFNLFLAPFDTWAAATTYGVNETAFIATNDITCTDADLQPDLVAAAAAISIDARDQTWLEAYTLGTLSEADTAALTNAPNCPDTFDGATVVQTPRFPVLSGDAQLIDVLGALAFSTAPKALKNFNLFEGSAPISDFASLDLAGGQSLTTPIGDDELVFGESRDAVTAALMIESLALPFARDPAIGGRTDLLLTFPTRHLYDQGQAPFADNLEPSSPGQGLSAVGADRDGERYEPLTGDITPPPPTPLRRGPQVTESQLNIHFTTPIVEFSAMSEAIPLPAPPSTVESGTYWLSLSEFNLLSADGAVIPGLPAIPVSLSAVRNGTIDFGQGRIEANYGWLNRITVTAPTILRP